MPRKYKRSLGARAYRNYTDEALQNALTDIRLKKLSYRQASEKYGIHRNTLFIKMHNKNPKKVGGQTVLSSTEENSLIGHIIAMANFGFPVTPLNIRHIVKEYLDKAGRKITCFKNNLPGKQWMDLFLARHKTLSKRVAKNITHSRAASDQQILDDFFNHLEAELEGIPASRIWNYDETNLVDDPGTTKIITKRGTKYPERIRNSSKACTSIMVCGNAAGELAPIYVNYKAEKMWSTWCENGPLGARYNRTKSGWFDSQSFEDWFVSLMLPILKKQEGCKVLIGDNLSSHINLEVLRQCEENNIKFIALPPNATHLLQPLDVAFFRPMKNSWRKILTRWKENLKASRYSTIPKDEFPSLLRELLKDMSPNSAENLRSGFRKTGIFPLNREEPMSRLPERISEREDVISQNVSEVFLDHLKRTRSTITENTTRKRRKKLNIPPGKSIGCEDVLANPNTPVPAQEDLTATVEEPTGHDDVLEEESGWIDFQKSLFKKKIITEFENDSNNSSFSLHDSSDHNCSDFEDPSFIEDSNEEDGVTDKANLVQNINIGDFILVEFISDLGRKKQAAKYYIGRVKEKMETENNPQYYCTFLRASKPNTSIYHFPQVEDNSIIDFCQVKCLVQCEKEYRGKYYFKDLPSSYTIS